VHDELLLEAPLGEVDAVCERVPAIMSAAGELSVPLVVDVGRGQAGTRPTDHPKQSILRGECGNRLGNGESAGSNFALGRGADGCKQCLGVTSTAQCYVRDLLQHLQAEQGRVTHLCRKHSFEGIQLFRSSRIRTHSDAFGRIRTHSDVFGRIRTHSDVFGRIVIRVVSVATRSPLCDLWDVPALVF